jgi:hypothetical protein
MTNIPRARRRAVTPRLSVRLGGLLAVRGDGTLAVLAATVLALAAIAAWVW